MLSSLNILTCLQCVCIYTCFTRDQKDHKTVTGVMRKHSAVGLGHDHSSSVYYTSTRLEPITQCTSLFITHAEIIYVAYHPHTKHHNWNVSFLSFLLCWTSAGQYNPRPNQFHRNPAYLVFYLELGLNAKTGFFSLFSQAVFQMV